LGEINQRKKLRKVKKKWVIVGTTVVCGLLTPVALRASANATFEELVERFTGMWRSSPESEIPLDPQAAMEKVSGLDGVETARTFTSQIVSLQDHQSAKGVEPLQDLMPEVPLPEDPGMSRMIRQLEVLPTAVQPRESTQQQVLQSVANETLEQESERPTQNLPSPAVVEQVQVQVEKIIELPSPEALEKAEQLKEAQAKADALLKEQEKREAEIQRLNATVGEKEKEIENKEKALQLRKNTVDELKGILDYHKETEKELNIKIQNTEQVILDLERQLEIETDETKRDDLISRKVQLEAKLKQQIDERNKLKAKIAKEQDRYNAKMKEYSNEVEKLKRLKIELDNIKLELSLKKDNVLNESKEIKSLTLQIRALKGEITPIKVDVKKTDDHVTITKVFEDDGSEFTVVDKEKLKTVADISAQLSPEVKGQVDPFKSADSSVQEAAMTVRNILDSLDSTCPQQETNNLAELMTFLQGWLSSLSRADRRKFQQDVSALQAVLDIWTSINSLEGLNSAINSLGGNYVEGLRDLKSSIYQWLVSSNLSLDSLFLPLTQQEASRLKQMLSTYKQEGEAIIQQKKYVQLHLM
jgi:myosin heavy subunit